MPRVARRKDAGTANSPLRSPRSIPLHDDQHEKAERLQSRQALQEHQLSQIRAAASPGHRRAHYDQFEQSDKDAASTHGHRPGQTDASWAGIDVPGGPNAKRVPILANFEEWMKMATDNKINAANSWNFALIDYFHDMSLLKEGDGVNFQKASCTLDGCVKIYTSRVDSVATETGKLLSGLADSRNKEEQGTLSSQDAEEDEEGEGDEEGGKKTRKKTTRSSEATLVASFVQLQLRKFELEFAVDPLFKKASADFDEGGAKGLLLNHLCIDHNGRIIFDSSDDTETDSDETLEVAFNEEQASLSASDGRTPNIDRLDEIEDLDINLDYLRTEFFPDLTILDEQDICPSLKLFNIGETMDLSSLLGLQDDNQKGIGQDPIGERDQNMGLLALSSDDLKIDTESGFGTGGEAWAQEAGLETFDTDFGFGVDTSDDVNDENADEDDIDDAQGLFGIRMHFGANAGNHPDILGYFDNTVKANWAGPEHWRIRKIRKENVPRDSSKRKEREPFEINFQSPMAQKVAEQIYTSANSTSAISIPKSQWRSKNRHLLPDDKHFSSHRLLRLFLKPKAHLGRRGTRKTTQKHDTSSEPRHIDDTYWAKAQVKMDSTLQGDYDADFFREDDTGFPIGLIDEDIDEFADAREAFSPAFAQNDQTGTVLSSIPDVNGSTESGYGSTLVMRSRRLRPEYVSYAKVAKKVDVRLLKEKMWKGIGFDDVPSDTSGLPQKFVPLAKTENMDILRFTSVINGLQDMYTPDAMSEISTSYCFISLLHLANEKGLILRNEEGLEELSIKKDYMADLTAAA